MRITDTEAASIPGECNGYVHFGAWRQVNREDGSQYVCATGRLYGRPLYIELRKVDARDWSATVWNMEMGPYNSYVVTSKFGKGGRGSTPRDAYASLLDELGVYYGHARKG